MLTELYSHHHLWILIHRINHNYSLLLKSC
nr:MAG TPA: hypothetical protein [Bacteriophage sp.]